MKLRGLVTLALSAILVVVICTAATHPASESSYIRRECHTDSVWMPRVFIAVETGKAVYADSVLLEFCPGYDKGQGMFSHDTARAN